MLLLALAPSIEGKPTGKHNTSSGCGSCHYGGTVTPGHNFPSTYTPGTTYNIQISIQGATPGTEGGFSLNVDKGAYLNNGPDVSFAATSATHTNPSQRSWMFDWTAPPAGSGTVSVELATLAANSNGANTGDEWGTTTHSIAELVSNQAPSATNVQIFSSSTSSKTNVVEDTAIGISYTYSDAENDPEVTADTEIKWYKGNVIQQMYNDYTTLPATAITAGETWHATVAPHDGTTLGSAVQSNSITVDAAVIPNNAPTISNYEITAATAGSNVPVNEDLWLGYVYDDSDGDTESGTSIRWFKDSVEQTVWNDIATLPSSATSVGDSWTATITPSDGMDNGVSYDTAAITIIDIDSDGDGVFNENDEFPNDASETMDSDSDGVGDNSDAFPNDAAETMDSDLDGVGDNADAFPNDASETMDSDGNGVGDNAQAAAEAKSAKLAAEEREMYMMIAIAAVVIILSLAAVMMFMKKKDGGEPLLTTKEYDTPHPLPQTQPVNPQPVSPQPVAEVIVASEVQRWTDAEGHTWRTMSDNSTQWWNGSDWQQR